MDKITRIVFLPALLVALRLEAKIIEVDSAHQARIEFEKIDKNTLLIFNYGRASVDICEYAFRNYKKKFLLELEIRDYLLLTAGRALGEHIETIKSRAYIFCHKILEDESKNKLLSTSWSKAIANLQSRGIRVILPKFHKLNIRGIKSAPEDLTLELLLDAAFRQSSKYGFKKIIFVDSELENLKFAEDVVKRSNLDFSGINLNKNIAELSFSLGKQLAIVPEKRHWLIANKYLDIIGYFIARFFLIFGHVEFIVPVVAAGILLHRRKYYGTAACFICFTMIFNTFLKNFFKVPLNPHLGSGFAFPSGHMHASMMFYGYIFYAIDDSRVKAMLVILLSGLGFALVRCNFHDIFDILGAVVFALSEITMYHCLLKKFGRTFVEAFAVIFAALIITILNYFYRMYSFIWPAFYILTSSIICMRIFRKINLDGWVERILSVIITIGAVLMINLLNKVFGLEAVSQLYLSKFKVVFFIFALFSSIPIGRSMKKFALVAMKRKDS